MVAYIERVQQGKLRKFSEYNFGFVYGKKNQVIIDEVIYTDVLVELNLQKE
jgi:hypothetical protein